jgi:hypothetical protein
MKFMGFLDITFDGAVIWLVGYIFSILPSIIEKVKHIVFS